MGAFYHCWINAKGGIPNVDELSLHMKRALVQVEMLMLSGLAKWKAIKLSKVTMPTSFLGKMDWYDTCI